VALFAKTFSSAFKDCVAFLYNTRFTTPFFTSTIPPVLGNQPLFGAIV